MSEERKKLWEPSDEWIENAEVTKFIRFVNEKYSKNIQGAKDLYNWSVENIPEFWKAFWEFADIKASQTYTEVVDDINKFPGCRWFPDAKLNFAENLLRYDDEQLAFIFQGESKKHKEMTYSELNETVARLAKSLRDFGIKKEDRIVSYIPNLIETPIAMLATTAIGAIWASCGAELQARAVIDRFAQIEPRILFAVDGYYYKNKVFNILPNVKEVVDSIPSIEKVVVVSYVSEGRPDISNIPNAVHWEDFISKEENVELKFEQVPFEHPVYIMFSSGTTGKPKCMVQSGGGVLINHLKELILSTDLRRSDVITYITAPSWMMI